MNSDLDPLGSAAVVKNLKHLILIYFFVTASCYRIVFLETNGSSIQYYVQVIR